MRLTLGAIGEGWPLTAQVDADTGASMTRFWNLIRGVAVWIGQLIVDALRVLVGAVFVAALLALLLAVPAGAVYWFLQVTNGGKIDAGAAFIGLGYIAGAAAIVALAALWAVRMYAVVADETTRRRLMDRIPATRFGTLRVGNLFSPSFSSDHRIVLAQLRYGSLLVIGGASLAVIFGLTFNDDKGVALAIGTAVVGAGAALLPAGAAATASNRILQTLPDRSSGQPSVATGELVGAARKDGATVQAAVRPAGRALTIYAEYGPPGNERENRTPAATVDAQRELMTTNIDITGLKPKVSYTYRVVVQDAQGNSWRGDDRQFTTPE
jgi:hypothetical protein